MDSLEQKHSIDNTSYTNYDDTVLQAADMPEFQDVVKGAAGKVNAITEVRKLLGEHFPEISDIIKDSSEQVDEDAIRLHNPLFGRTASDQLVAAKQIVDLLWEE
jgi:hypothetical protein